MLAAPWRGSFHHCVAAMSKLLPALKLIGTYLLALLAAFTWGLPPAGVAPWALRASWIGAIILFLLLASLPRTRKLCLHLSGISLAAFFCAGMWWQLWMSSGQHNPGWLYTVAKLIGTAGEGKYLLVEYQMFLLMFVAVGIVWGVMAIPSEEPAQRSEKAAG
jgi:hypothetical protein